MAALEDIRAAFAAKIADVFPDAQCTGYVLSQPQPPFFDIELAQEGISYDQAMSRGLDLWRFTIRGCVSYNLDLQAQKQLDAMCATTGAGSMKQALEADQTLNGVAQAVRVTNLSGYRNVGNTSPGAQPSGVYTAAEWTVEVYVSGR